ncbi:hypothetical protein Tco_0466106 [Tanacetum coccineum]
MRDANPIRTPGYYSKPRHEGYRNTIKLLVGKMWYLFDPTPSDWCKTDAHSTDFEGLVSNFMASQDARLSKFEADFKQQQSEMTNKINTVLKAITDRIARALPSDTVKNPKLSTSSVLFARSYPTEDPQCSTHVHGSINTIMIHPKQQNDSHDSMAEEEERERQANLRHQHIAHIEEPENVTAKRKT